MLHVPIFLSFEVGVVNFVNAEFLVVKKSMSMVPVVHLEFCTGVQAEIVGVVTKLEVWYRISYMLSWISDSKFGKCDPIGFGAKIEHSPHE